MLHRQVWKIGSNVSETPDSVHLNINQFDAINFIISLFQASTCFEHMCSLSGGQNCTIQSLVSSHYPIGGRPVHRLREDSVHEAATYRVM